MTTKDDTDDDDGRGCLFIIGLIIVGICVGNMYTASAGWLIIGGGLLFAALLPSKKK